MRMDANSRDAHHRRLRALGADAFAHVNGALGPHLAKTERLLRAWGSREALCTAGLYHAVYGTDGIRGSLAGLERRSELAGTIGAEAEAIVYLYGACDRDVFHPRIGTADRYRFVDRFTGAEHVIAERELRDFCELTVANELELALASERFRTKHRVALTSLFDRMDGLLSAGATGAYRQALCR
jgi:hypothetical protein